MYTLPNKLKLFAIIFMVVGALGILTGFLTTPGSTAEVKEMMASHGDGHGETHSVAAVDTDESHAVNAEHNGGHDENAADSEEEHLKHTLHQMQNRPWSALYIAAFFFFMIALGTLAFYAIQWASQAGWSPVLYRVMEAITAYLVPGGIIMFVLLALSGFHINHLFVWADPDVVAHDKLLQGKAGWLNGTAVLIRAAIFLGGWMLYRHFAVKFSRKSDETTDNKWFKKSFKISAGFLVFFIYTESIMSWDWLMSFDPHWFSTLFGWYVFAGMMVCAFTVIAMITIYLKSKGYLEFVNNSHIHDMGKWMFAFSIFWTYLWFSQFMLIWYANIPEEVTYFVTRIEDFKLPFFGMLAMNFVFPVLLLMNSDYKRVNWFVILTGIVILAGHYIDVYLMVTPGTVGTSWYIGIPEIGSLLFFFGLFVFVVFSALTKAPLLVKNNPFVKESKNYHY
ncbi:quinol:cytochrome c oxidoreductase quinone-binding subunit 2 [Ulvibacter sp. MAR_2010_11]|uniref:quinol:cytochrome C oxidoreductase n=1 Tax=Ulvibacter sp. MAR_2010_11 TaxID=1250229 RepID=UPI000C2C407F|nr:quinol:cytochrome C oxidoreductase [Ulvibacter sp. MAR_2010_11]PKA83248.1 quinol:cytochrome c oxidoreductase quinone-binding subunit 2 [Ulvibacter sp. MAR_2010_11]